MKIQLLVLICCVLILISCSKKDKVNPNTTQTSSFSFSTIFQDNMVIQRDKPLMLWGKAIVGDKVVVNVSWNTTPFYANTDVDGNWKVSIPASPVNSNPQTISASIEGKTPIMVSNILIGDVWICSGQSNMVMPVGPIAPFTGVLNYPDEIANANYPQIRAFTVITNSQASPVADLPNGSKWDICSPATVGNISAVAYFFARKLNTDLNVPIGVVVSAVNNTLCTQWMNKEAFLSTNDAAGGEYYNGMIAPLINLSVKGFIWYQGENDENQMVAATYTQLNTALINGWRTAFNQGALPFYYVQLAPFDNGQTGDATLDDIALFREGQALIRTNVTNSGMAVTMDIGDVLNHHPPNKKPLGERLALLALKNDYGKNVIAVGPQYSSFTVNNNTATISFVAGTGDGLTTGNNFPLNQYFFVAGTDQVLRQGKAVINGNTIIVTAPADTPLPIQTIRYAFTNFPITNLQNSAGLPAEPFRSGVLDVK